MDFFTYVSAWCLRTSILKLRVILIGNGSPLFDRLKREMQQEYGIVKYTWQKIVKMMKNDEK